MRRAASSTGRFHVAAALLLALWVLVPVAHAVSPGLRIAVFEAEAGVGVDALARSAAQAGVRAEPGAVRVGGQPGRVHWIHVQADLPSLDNGDRHWVLVLPRLPINELTLHRRGPAGWTSETRRFYAPTPDEPPIATSFSFRLPHDLSGPQELWLSVSSEIVTTLEPRLVLESVHAEADRQLALLLMAVYAGVLVLGLSGLALCIALRDGAYLSFVAFVAASLPLMLAVNGHLFALPLWGALGAWGLRGLCVVGFLAGAAALLLARDLAGLRATRPRMHRMLGLAATVHALLAVVYLVLPVQWAPMAFPLAWAAWGAMGGLCLWTSVRAWRDGRPLARPVTLVWMLVLGGIVLRALMSGGVLEPGVWTLYGFQLALGGSAFLFSIALADRVMEFRFQRERIREAKERSEGHLHVEQVRRQFTERLQDELRESSLGDMQWRAFHRLLDAVGRLVPNRGALVVANDYHGFDLLIPDPIQAKARYTDLIAKRGQTFRAVARSRLPMQVKIDDWAEAEGGGMFAVIPLQVARPGWGAVLVERGDEEPFQPEELQRIAEFTVLATNATDEAIAAIELKRRAELDPLTGAYNRRAMDHLLALRTSEAHVQRKPLSVLFVDLDHFKQVNDRHGHGAGDDCLRAVADAIRARLGPEDLFGRFGGEEFVVVLPGKPAEQARALGERLRQAVADLRVQAEGAVLQLTVSIGVAARLPRESQPQAIVERADKALYAAKRSGRNQVQVASAPGGEGAAMGSPYL